MQTHEVCKPHDIIFLLVYFIIIFYTPDLQNAEPFVPVLSIYSYIYCIFLLYSATFIWHLYLGNL